MTFQPSYSVATGLPIRIYYNFKHMEIASFFVELACGEQDIVVTISVQCMYIVRLSAFVRAVTSTFMHGF